MTGYSLGESEQRGEDVFIWVHVNSRSSSTPVQLQFQVARQELGRKKNSFMTKSLKKV